MYSEYIGTKIFELCGFETQKVELGIYNKDGKERIVCGCEDFTDSDTKLVEFEKFEKRYLICMGTRSYMVINKK